MRRLGILFLLLCVAIGSARAADVPAQKFVVFFQEWSAALDDSAQAVISQAAEWVKSHPGNVAHVNGFADPTGSTKANICCPICARRWWSISCRPTASIRSASASAAMARCSSP